VIYDAHECYTIIHQDAHCTYRQDPFGEMEAPDGINNRNSRGQYSRVTGLSTDHLRFTLDDARRGLDTRQSSIAFSFLGGVEIE
jgi:hypothetical protein